MKALPYVISNKALADIDEIWSYTAETWSLEQANRYYILIFDEINYICTDPESGRSMHEIREGYRVVKVKSHYIFYRQVDHKIEIIRILHERMDVENLLRSGH